VPPAAPTFTNQITKAWSDSLLALRTFGERLVVAAVYLAPWFFMLCVLIVPAYWYFNRRHPATKHAAAPGRPADST
jgi:hypothetical protein